MDCSVQPRTSHIAASNVSSHASHFTSNAMKISEGGDIQHHSEFNTRLVPPPQSCPMPGTMHLSLGMPMNSTNSATSGLLLRHSPFAQKTLNLSHYSQAKQTFEHMQTLQQHQQASPTSPVNTATVWMPHQQQQPQANAGAPNLRQRQQLVIPTNLAARPISLHAVPPLLTPPDELAILEPHISPVNHSQQPTTPGISAGLGKDTASSAAVDHDATRAYRRTVSSPNTWNNQPLVSTGHLQPVIGSTGSVNTHPAVYSSGEHRLSHAGMPASSPAISTITGPSSAGKVDPGSVSDLSHPTPNGNTNVVKAMLAELPSALQPVVLAKVAVRGRGGRQPAPDPRSTDPTIDPRKARRILANRQSAARSKLKQRVLLETLRVGKEVMAVQQGTVQEELARLREQVKDLEARNTDLEMQIQALAGQATSHAQAPSHVSLHQGVTWQGVDPNKAVQPSALPRLGTDVFDANVQGWWEEDTIMDSI